MTPIQIPDGIQALGPDVTARLQSLIVQAEERQEAEAQAALETALQIVPRPVRGIVRKVLIG